MAKKCYLCGRTCGRKVYLAKGDNFCSIECMNKVSQAPELAIEFHH